MRKNIKSNLAYAPPPQKKLIILHLCGRGEYVKNILFVSSIKKLYREYKL